MWQWLFYLVVFSSRRRHTMCALVTGFQTCALPIFARVDLEDLLTALDVGAGDDDLAVEATRAQQRGVEHVGAVGRGDDDDAFIRFEAVHLDEQLVQRLLALVVAVAEAGAAMAADRVDFVDEDDARRVALRLFEHVADARRTP